MAYPVALFAKRYVLHEELGAGGMGTVYRATDRLTGQVVALKRVLTKPTHLQFNSESDFADHRIALANEFRILASLRHPHIISVLDYGFDEQGHSFFTMAYLPTPQNLLEAAEDLTLKQQIGLLVQVLQALAYLHRRGIIHRDLKPGNVLVTNRMAAGHEVRVLDFGLSMSSDQSRGVAGTLAYMAPEILESAPASPASDLYAVGIMLYEMLAGRHPYDTSKVSNLINDMMTSEPDLRPLLDSESRLRASQENQATPDADGLKTLILTKTPDLPEVKRPASSPPADPSAPTIAQIVGKLLAKKPADRYTDAHAVIQALAQATGIPLPSETRATRESFLQAAAFVGREAEMSQLTAALDRMIDGAGSGWLIGGESGVGKSRLLNELQTHALVEGVTVIQGQATSEGSAPYSVWRDGLRRLVLMTDLTPLDAAILKPLVPDIEFLLEITDPLPELPPVAPQIAQERLLDAIVSLFIRQAQPILIILEDLHWAYESLEVIRRLLPSLHTLPLLLIGTYRDDERPTLPEELAGLNVMPLDRLSEAEIRTLSEAMLGEPGQQKAIVELLRRETEGNAFFVVEVVRTLAEDAGRLEDIGKRTLPGNVFSGGIATILRHRLERVPAPARPLLEFAAVLGRNLDLKLLQETTSATELENWLLDCAAAHVLEVRENQWRFSHDKLREGLLLEIAPQQQQALHQRAAQTIEAVYANDATYASAYASALTFHWGAAKNPSKEQHYAALAGQQAFQNSAYADAKKFIDRAVTLSTHESPAQRLPLYLQLGEIEMGLANYPAAKSAYEQAQKFAEKLQDTPRLIEAMIGAGRASDDLGQREEAATTYAQALNLAQAGNYPVMIARALVYSSVVDSLQDNYDSAYQRLKEAIGLYEALNELPGLVTAYAALGSLVRHMGIKAEARYYVEKSLELSRQLGLRARTAEALGSLGVIEADEQNFELGLHYFNESLVTLREIGGRDGIAATLQYIAATEVLLDRPLDAIQHSLEALAIFRELGHVWGIAYVLNGLGDATRMAGEYAESKDYYAEALKMRREIADPLAVGVVLCDSGLLRCDIGEFDDAMAMFEEAVPLLFSIGAIPFTLYGLVGVARVWANRGRVVEAIELLGLCRSHPASDSYVKFNAEPALAQLRHGLAAAVVESALAKGAGFAVEQRVEQVVNETSATVG